MPDASLQRFNENWLPHPQTNCWVWVGSINAGGYGLASLKEGSNLAHRASWLLHVGPIPKGKGYHGTCVCHRCDNRKCVNPAHLFLGDHDANMRDKAEKGRATEPTGEANASTKLTESIVGDIRSDQRSERVICVDYGISRSLVGQIKRREIWSYLP